MFIKFGIHLFIWTSRWDNSSLDLVNKAKDIGFDFIEIPLIWSDFFSPEKLTQRLKSTGIECCASVCLTDKTDITSSDKDIRANGVRLLKNCIITANKIEAYFLIGVTYSAFGKNIGRPPTEEEWNFSASCLREVARFTKQYRITIGNEPVNRYETYLINTVHQARKLIQMIGEPNVKVYFYVLSIIRTLKRKASMGQ